MELPKINLKNLPFFQEEEKRAARRPEVLKTMKAKYLVAIGKSDRQDLPKEVDDENAFGDFGAAWESMQLDFYWRDSKVNDMIKSIKKPEFEISVYVNSAKYLFMYYLGDVRQIDDNVSPYLMFFARDFNDTRKHIVNIEGNGTRSIVPDIPKNIISMRLDTSTNYMKQVQKLIDELCINFDENKFVKLNVNVTYILLLMFRRKVVSEEQFINAFTKDATHECYKKLCPHTFDEKLPLPAKFEISSLYSMVTLPMILDASRTAEAEGLLKRILNATCLKHMEGHGLALPTMFNQVVSLYNVSENDLWDLLCVDQTERSFFKMYKLYNFQYNERNEHTFHLFPFCRVINTDYHSLLSGSMNEFLCTTLAYLIDMKIGMDKSFVRNAHWAKSHIVSKNFGERFAKVVYEKIFK